VQIPFYSLEFTNLANPDRPRNNSFGDIRFLAKYRLLQESIIWSVTLGAKSPTGKFDIDAEAVNVSEGQWDFDLFTEISKSFWPVSGYASLGIGYRIRTDNNKFEYTIPNELLLSGEIGYELIPRLMFKGTIGWLYSKRPRIKVTNTPLLVQRELLAITPGMIYRLSEQLNLEAAVRFPVLGQDFPNGQQFMVSASYQFSLW
jgi:hypothetical protein